MLNVRTVGIIKALIKQGKKPRDINNILMSQKLIKKPLAANTISNIKLGKAHKAVLPIDEYWNQRKAGETAKQAQKQAERVEYLSLWNTFLAAIRAAGLQETLDNHQIESRDDLASRVGMMDRIIEQYQNPSDIQARRMISYYFGV